MSGSPLARAMGRLRLDQQLALVAGVLALLAVGGAFSALATRLRANAATRFAEELGQTQRTLVRLQQRASDQQLWTASLVGESPTLRAAMETYRVESTRPTTSSRHEALLSTLQRSADEQLDGLASDLLVVLDADGRVLAASARQATAPKAGASLATVPAVRHALDPAALVDSANLGVLHLREGYYGVAAAPILLGGYTIGALVLGERIDQAYVHSLQQAFDGEIVVVAGRRTIGTTVAASAGVDSALADHGAAAGVRALGAKGEEYVVASIPMGTTEAREPVTLYLLHSVTRSVGELIQPLRRDFVIFGTFAALLAALGAGLASGSVLAPLQRIVAAMRASARTGTFARTKLSGPAPRELRWLAESYGQLIDALDAERAAVVRRTHELEETNARLLAQVQERERAERTLEEREAQLRQSQKLEAVGTLAGGVAHDFNNLLTVIAGYTDIALVQLPADAPAASDMREVKAAARRAGQLTQQLLAFSRKQVLQPRVLDLNGVVSGVETMLRRLVGEHVELRVELDPALARVEADPVQMEQVLMNLAVNARDAMTEGGELVIATVAVAAGGVPGLGGEARGVAGVALVVRDTGTGMDAAVRERIFEPFYTTKEPGKGTGLGLATVYGIVQQSGGTIWVESELGRGTTFHVVLPAIAGGDDAVDGVIDLELVMPRGSETILLVEDEDQVRALAERVLRARGYTVLAASRGAEALHVAMRHHGRIDLLLTDVVMPQMTGRELARRMLELRPQTRVLFMSGHSDDAVALHGQLAAGTAFMRKPFSPEEISRIVRSVLDAEAADAVA